MWSREIPRDLRILGLLRDLVRSDLANQGVDVGTAEDVALCLHEACANSVLHGSGTLRVGWGLRGGEVVVEVCDEGAGPRLVPEWAEPDLDQVSGRGLFLIRKLARRLETSAQGGGVCLRFALPAAGREPVGAW